MPTTRQRRKRPTQATPVVDTLLAGDPVARTEENRLELVGLRYFGRHDYAPDHELGSKLEELAAGELERWKEP